MMKLSLRRRLGLLKHYAREFKRRRLLSRVGNFQQIDGWLTEAEAIKLWQLAKAVDRGGTILEIGSWKGKSTVCLGLGLRSGKLIAIDSFDAFGESGSSEVYAERRGETPLLEEFKQNIKRSRIEQKVEIWHGRSEEFAARAVALNLLFIDGDHSIDGCKADYLNFAPKLMPRGLLAFHDFDPARPDLGPTWVVNNLVLTNSSYRFVGLFDSLWVAEKLS